MPVLADSFRRIRLIDQTTPGGPLDIEVVADDRNDTLNLQAGIGISLIVDPVTDSIIIYNTGSPVGIANLDDILQVGNTSSIGMDVGSVTVDQTTLNNNTISTTLNNNLTLTPGPSGGILVVDSVTAIRIPLGAENQRPAVGTNPGYIRFNLDKMRFEGFNGSAWSSLGGVTSDDGGTTIEPGVDGGSPLLIFKASNETVATFSAYNNKFFSRGFQIPTGPTGERPSPPQEGMIRYNTTTDQFEGYNGIGWSSLGGVRDIDGNTYIIPEANPGTNDNTLYFVTNGDTALTLDGTKLSIKGERALRFEEPAASGSNYIDIKTPSEVTATYTLKLPRQIGSNGDILSLNNLGELEFTPADSFAGGRVIVSADFGDDINDGINKPVKTIKRALQIASGFVYDSNQKINGKKIVINVASGDYVEDNPIIIPDNVSVLGAGLRACNVRPANANKDFLRVRNGCYFGEFTFRDFVDANQVPVHTFDYAVAFDDPLDTLTSRVGYTNLPTTKPVISVSPYVQNVSILSFLGGNGVLVDGNLVQTPNSPSIQAIVENPVEGPAPEQGKSMVANAFTMLSFGGTGWRIINDAYAQIVSCFQIFMLNGSYCQSGGYLSITNSATNFGLYALRASGYSRNAFQFDKGYVALTGTSETQQTITALGFGRLPTQDFILRFRSPQYRIAHDLLLSNKSQIQTNTITWISQQITGNIPPFTNTFTYDQVKCSRDVGLIIDAVAFDVLTGGNAKSVEAGLSYFNAQSAVLNSQKAQNIAAFEYAKSLAQASVTSTGLSSYVGNKFDIVIDTIDDPTSAPAAVGFSNDGDITSNFKPSSIEKSFLANQIDVLLDTITISAHGFVNGDSVIYDNNGNADISGLDNEQTYFVRRLDDNTIELYFDESRKIKVNILAIGSGTHKFIKNLQEFYLDEIKESHNSYQELTLAAGTYTFVPGRQITGVSGGGVNSAFVHSYDPVNRKLIVSLNQVAVGLSVIRNPFVIGSTIDNDNGSPVVSNIIVTAIAPISYLYTATFSILSTTANGQLTNLSNLPYNQIWLHRPSIVNSSSHTWEYAGSGTDYNALPQNGGQTIEAYEQYADLPGRVYTSGTNELGDFKVGDFIKAENKTGNVSFTNKVSVAELDALRLAIGDIVIEFISNDIGLGDNEPGGASDSRLSTQKAIRSFLANRLGGFIDKAVSTNAVPGAVVQLNSSGQINPDLLPAVRAFNSAKGEGFNSRQYLVEEVPAYDFLNGDIVTEEYATVQLTLNRSITASLGDLVTQANSNARGLIVSDVNSDTVITVASENLTFTNNFNITDILTIDGDATPSDSNQTVTPTIVGTVANNVNGNHVLSNANESQYLVLSPNQTYNFTIGNFITSANDNIQGEITSTRYGVIATVDNAALIGGSGYSPASGTQVYKFVTLTGGSGNGAKADITVTNGSVTSVDMRRGGTGYANEELLSASASDLGGGSPTAFSVKITGIEKRVYVDLTGGERFVATLASPNYIADNNAPVKTVDLTGTSQKSFNAQDISLGGAVDYANSRITLSSHGYANGDPVKYVSTPNTAIGNLANNNVYYVKVFDANTIELHETYNVNSKITFSSSSSGTHNLVISNINTINSTVYSVAHGFSTGDALRLTGAVGAALPLVNAVRIISGTFFFVGSRTDNSFTIHANRSEALASVNGLTISKIVFDTNQTGTTGNGLFTKQNVSVIRTVNTSSTNLENWGSLSANTLDASSIVSGTISTTRLASQGSANDKTFLRGDSTWANAVQTVKEINSPITISGDFVTVTEGVAPNQISVNRYYGNIQLDIDRVDSNQGDALYSNLGVAKFSKIQFDIGTGPSVGQVSVKSGVIDAGLLDGQDGVWYTDSANHTVQPVDNGGTGLQSYSAGDILYAQSSNSLQRLAISTTAGALLTSSGTMPQWSTNLSVPGTLAVTNATDSTSSTTGAFTVTGGAGIGKSLTVGDNLNVGKDLIVSGNLNVKGTTTSINSTIATVLDKNLELGVVVISSLSTIKGTLATDGLNYTISTLTKDGVPVDATALIGPYVTPTYKPQIRKVSGTGGFGVGTVILSVPNTTSIVIEPTPTITLGEVTFNILTPTDSTANEGGITLLGDTNKSFNWINATDSWTSSENIELAANKIFKIDGVEVLSKTSLGSSVTTSSLTQFGTITVGTWQATVIRPEYGGTGVNNGNKKITLAGETNQALSGVVVSNTTGGFTCAAATLVVNDRIAVSGTNLGNGSITGYTNPTTYKISATNGTTSFTLVNLNGTAIVTGLGPPPNNNGSLTGLTFTRIAEHNLTVTMSADSSVTVPTTGTLATLAGTETLENKTLAAVKIRDSNGDNTYDLTVGNLSVNRTINLPVLTGNDTFVFAAHTQTLSGKTLTLPKINDTSSDHTYNFAVSELADNRTITLPLLGSNDTFVFESHTQTLSGKTLTLPKINDLSSNHTYNFAVSELTANRIVTLPLLENNDTFVFQNFAQTLDNKNLVDANTYFVDNVVPGLKFNFQASAVGVGSGLQLTVTTNGTGQVSSVSGTIPNAGSNYRSGDVVTISGPGSPSALATYTISGVNAAGAVTAGSLTTNGAGYTASQTAASTTNLIGATRTFTVPAFSTTLVGTDIAQTISNKEFVDETSVFVDDATSTKKFKFQASSITANQTRTLTIPDKDGTIAVTTDFATLGGDGQLTLNVAGNGLSGTATFTANQTGNSTFTVTSNATADNTENTIVYRGINGNFSAGTITATAFDGKLVKTVTGTDSAELIRATMGTNDYFRIQVGSITAADNGFVEIATADNGTEPIYVRQYEGDFATLKRTATLLGPDGNTTFPGTVTATDFIGKISLTASDNLSSESYITFVDTATGNQDLRTDTGLRYNASLNKIFLGAIEETSASNGINLNLKNAETANTNAGDLIFYGGRGKGTGRGSSMFFYGGYGSVNESSAGQGGGIYFAAGRGSKNSNAGGVILGDGGIGGPIQLDAGDADNRGIGSRLILTGGWPDTTKPLSTTLIASSARLLTDMPGGDLELKAGGSTGSAAGGEIKLYTSAAGSTGNAQNGLLERLTVKATGQISLSANITSTSSSTGTLVVTGGVGISENLNVNGDVTVTGTLTVNGTTTTINSTTLAVDDKNIELGTVDSPTNDTADGGGIILKGASDKTFTWIKATEAWTSSENVELDKGKKLVLAGSTSGKITLSVPAEAGTHTITLPAATGTVALTSDIPNVSNFITLSSLSITSTTASGGGSLSYNNSTGAFTFAPADVSNFITLSSLSVTTAAASGNGSLAYNNTTGAFTFTPPAVPTFVETDTLATVTGRTNGNTTATAISLTNTTASTSSSTGALTVSGGVGIGGSVNIAGTLTADLTLTLTGTTPTLTSTNSATNFTITTATPATPATQKVADIIIRPPGGAAGGVGSTTLAGGERTTGTGKSGSTYVLGGDYTGIGGGTGGDVIIVGGSATGSTFATTGGDVIIDGGLAYVPFVGTPTLTNGAVYIGARNTGTVGDYAATREIFIGRTGTPTIFQSVTDSTSTTTGSIQVSGGVGISGNTNIGGYINVRKTVKSPYNIIAPVNDNTVGSGEMRWLDWEDGTIGAVVSTGTSPTGLDIHPWGTHLYVVASDADLLYQYRINQETGKLTPTPSNATIATPADPERVLVHSSGKTLYVTSSTQFSISAYTIATETLLQQSPISLSGNPRYLVQYPFGGFLYVSCPGENIIQQISINNIGSASGSIWSTVVNGPSGLAFDPTGRFLYVASEIDNKIYQYAILNSTGQLSDTPISSVTSNGEPKNILIDPTGRFLYSTSLLDDSTRVYNINQDTGALTYVEDYFITSDPYGLAIDPLGKHIYISSITSNLLYLRNINPVTGGITTASGGSPGVNGNGFPRGSPFDIKIDPTGRFMYVTNKTNNSISQFRLHNLSAGGASFGEVTILDNNDSENFTTGALSVAGGVGIDGRINVANTVYTDNFFQSQYPTVSPVKPYGLGTGKILESLRTIACRDNPLEITIHPSGKFLYVANSSTQDGISQFSVNDDTGVVASLTPANVTTNSDVSYIVIHPSGRYLYATAQSEKLIYQYSINQTTGVLTALSTATIATAGNGFRIVIDPAGVYLYVANNDLNTITAYSINNTTGQLTNLNLSISSGGNNPNDMTFDPTGKHLYVNNTNSNGFQHFFLNRKTGKLRASGGIINTGGNPSDIYAEPSGRFLYVTRSSSTNIYIYKIDPVNGTPAFVNTATVINDARSVTSDPYGNCLYVCSPSTNQIQALAINPGTGELTSLNTVNAPGGAFVNELAVDPKGRFLYTLNQDLDTLQQYSLDSFSYSGGSFNGQTTFNQNLIVNGRTNVKTIIENFTPLAAATGVVTHNLTDSAVWYHTGVTANFTANFTNALDTNTNKITTVSLIINQGATAYIPNAVQIDGVAQTINWADNTVPEGVANRVQIFAFSLIRTNTPAWIVLGSAQAY